MKNIGNGIVGKEGQQVASADFVVSRFQFIHGRHASHRISWFTILTFNIEEEAIFTVLPVVFFFFDIFVNAYRRTLF